MFEMNSKFCLNNQNTNSNANVIYVSIEHVAFGLRYGFSTLAWMRIPHKFIFFSTGVFPKQIVFVRDAQIQQEQ